MPMHHAACMCGSTGMCPRAEFALRPKSRCTVKVLVTLDGCPVMQTRYVYTAVQVELLCNTTHVIDHSPPLLRLYDFSDPKMGLTAQCGSAHVITILVTTLLFRLLVLIVH